MMWGFLGSGLLHQLRIVDSNKGCEDQYILRLSFESFTPNFTTNGKGVVIVEKPENSICCLPTLSQSNCKSITVYEAVDIIQRQLKRQSSEEQNFRNCHVTVYQGKINKRAKKLISDTYNYGIYSKSWDILELPQIESVGLFYQGSIHSFYYIEETDTWVDQSTLDIFKDKREGIVVIKRTTSRVFSLVNLAAEKISESLSNKEELETLVRSTQIPAVCANNISRCL